MRFFNPVDINFEKGLLEKIEFKSVFVVVDKAVKKFAESIKAERLFIFDEVVPNPSVELVNNCAQLVNEFQPDSILGIGGGSSLDVAKAVACLQRDETIEDYLLGKKKFLVRKRKLVLVPTTAGTGSEVTNVSVFTHEGIKKPMTSDYFWADKAIIDPTLTYSLPPRVVATTGVDALVHAIESYWATTTQPFSQSIAMEAARIILENLEKSYNGDLNARDNMALAATMAGVAFSQTRTTAAHAISFPLTSYFGLEHGFACMITIPSLIEFVYPENKELMNRFIKYLGYSSVKSFVEELRSLMNRIKAPTKLSEIGVKESDLEKIIAEALKTNIIWFTPRKLSKEQLTEMLFKIL